MEIISRSPAKLITKEGVGGGGCVKIKSEEQAYETLIY